MSYTRLDTTQLVKYGVQKALTNMQEGRLIHDRDDAYSGSC